MSKTAEEILKEYGIETFDTYNPVYENIKKAMQEYAKEQCIEFAKWASQRYNYVEDDLWDGDEDTFLSTGQVYDLFIQSTQESK